MAMKYRKKPIQVYVVGPIDADREVITVNGTVKAKAGDFVVTDPSTGDTWPVSSRFFADTYELVDEETEILKDEIARLQRELIDAQEEINHYQEHEDD